MIAYILGKLILAIIIIVAVTFVITMVFTILREGRE